MGRTTLTVTTATDIIPVPALSSTASKRSHTRAAVVSFGHKCVCVCVHVIMREKKRARAIRLGLCMCNTKYIYVCIITSTALIYTYMYINGELCTRLMMLLWSTNAFWRGRRMQANTNYRFRITPTCAARIHDYTLFKINTHTHTLTNTRRIRLVKLLCTHVTCSFRETPTPRRV